MEAVGKVYLVGAGPGDPGLITVKGVRCLERSDVVIYDRLLDSRLLSHARPGAELIYAGKRVGDHVMTQGEINELLVAEAKQGKVVCRLKGGDPFVFGRGGEEADVLVEAGIPFEVVPGVTSAIAAPAYAGIPLTHRGYTSSFAVITGHERADTSARDEDSDEEGGRLAWDKLATGVGTLVCLMGVGNLPNIVSRLIEHGRSPETPVAVIQWGTWARQRTVEGTLESIVEKVKSAGIGAPAVTVIGEVASLRERLSWFDSRPLFGKRVLVTRSREQASRLSELLADLGAEPVEVPTIHIEEPEDYGPLDGAIARINEYQWVVFPSANGVESFFRRMRAAGRDVRSLAGVKMCAIGPATAKALEERGILVDLVPQQFTSAAAVKALGEQGIRGDRILLPRTDVPGEDLAGGLEALGATVEQVVAYRTVAAKEMPEDLLDDLREGRIDVVTFASSSTARNLVSLLGGYLSLLSRTRIASIGPITSATAQELGLPVDIEAQEHTVPGLVSAIVEGLR